jgi:CO/xanthine dehydrogenase FAD-binding subunit
MRLQNSEPDHASISGYLAELSTPARPLLQHEHLRLGADRDAIAAAAARVPEALGGAVGDTYASAEYRVHLAQVMAKRAIAGALGAAEG